MARMKTTIELPDGLVAEAKEAARSRGETLRSLVEAGLRRELELGRSESATPRPFVLRTSGGDGLMSGISAGQLRDLAYEGADSPR